MASWYSIEELRAQLDTITSALAAAGTGGSAAPVPVGGPSGATWSLVFEDHFTGTAINPDIWYPNWYGTSRSSITGQMTPQGEWPTDPYTPAPDGLGGISTADPANISVANSILTMNASDVDQATQSGAWHPSTQPFRGAAMHTNPDVGGHPGFVFKGGYIEFRAKLASKNGFWPALWTLRRDVPTTTDGELDIAEAGMNRWDQAIPSYIGSDGNSVFDVSGARQTYANIHTAWHTYAIHWEPGERLRYYYDGLLIATATALIPDAEHCLMIDLAVGNFDYPSVPTGTDTMQVDYVRVWEDMASQAEVDATVTRVAALESLQTYVPKVSIGGAGRTLALTDVGKRLSHTAATNWTGTIPLQATAAAAGWTMLSGNWIEFSNLATANWVKIEGEAAGMLLSPLDPDGAVDSITVPTNGLCHIDYDGSDKWVVSGYHTVP